MDSIDKLKRQVYEANLELKNKNLVVYTFGNVSGIDRKKEIIVIKPSGVPYENLNPEDMVSVDFHNNVLDGDKCPSSDTLTHIVLYKHFPSIGGVVHTHSTFATSWAQAKKPIPCLGTTHADYANRQIPCTQVISDKQIKGNYVEETGNQIIETFQNYSYEATPMVLVASHGPFTWGKDPDEAVYYSVILEELAKMAYLTMQINPHIEDIKQSLIDKHYNRKHGKNAYYGQKK
ncbi:MAG: L-ribulose-5-phosphate 4-epimerase AraD [Candidatus Lokiarchaeota archaeon]|nr:L-ribulose-5-phosphate 4-epimerase AraD [Candidatus Lokiarchaeota archaeon]